MMSCLLRPVTEAQHGPHPLLCSHLLKFNTCLYLLWVNDGLFFIDVCDSKSLILSAEF